MVPDQERRLRELEARMARIERRLAATEAAPNPAVDPWAETWTPPAPEAYHPVRPAALPARPGPPPPPPPFTPPAHAHARRGIDLEKALGARWLARAGVLVLALGVVFFLKLAYDRGWVPIPARFAIATLGGLGLFAVGDLLRGRRIDPHFAQILSGGGAVIAYVAVYMAWVWPDYRAALGLSLEVEVAMLAAVSALLAGYAVWRDLPVMAGVAVGLSALIVAPAGAFSTLGLLFVAFLDGALLAAAAWRRWASVLVTAAVAANAAHLAAALASGVPWQLVAASVVAVNAIALVVAHRSPAQRELRLAVSGFCVVACFAIAGLALARGRVPDAFAWTALALGPAALAGARASRPLAPALAIVGIALVLLWPLLHFPTDLRQTLAYAALAVASLGASFALEWARWLRAGSAAATAAGTASLFMLARAHGVVDSQPWGAGGLALALFAVGAALWATDRRATLDPTQAAGSVAATLLLVAWPFLQFPGSLWSTAVVVLGAIALAAAGFWLTSEQRFLHALALGAGGVGLLSLLVLATAHRSVQQQPLGAGLLAAALVAAALFVWWPARSAGAVPQRQIAVALAAGAPLVYLGFLLDGWQIAVGWAAAGVALAAAGIALRDLEVRLASFAVFGLVLGRIFLVDLQNLAVELRVLTFLFTGALLLLAAFLFARQRRESARPGPP